MNIQDSTLVSDPTSVVPATWESLNLHSDIMKLVQEAGFSTPTPVQAKAIPALLNGEDLMVSAQTGTGKTAAFCLPLIEKLRKREGTYALVLAPSREIANQTQTAFDQFGLPLGVRSVSLIGGVNMRTDQKNLQSYPQVVVATPGRLCDHLDRGNIWLDYLEFVVLDEADRMLDMGFTEQLTRILQETPSTRQTLLFSATFSESIERLGRRILRNPQRIQIGHAISPAKSVDQHFVFVDEESKVRALQNLIQQEPGKIFVFTRSKDRASRLFRSLYSRGFLSATFLHSDLKQADREQALEDFKNGKYRVLIATDVMGRGIHVDNVAHVVNFDFPRDAEDYVHRIGRTGRADSQGKATSFVTGRDQPVLRKVEQLLGRSIAGSAAGGQHRGGQGAGQKPGARRGHGHSRGPRGSRGGR